MAVELRRLEWVVAEPDAGRLDQAVRRAAGVTAKAGRLAVLSGKVFVEGQREQDPARSVAAGTRVLLDPAAPNPARVEPLGVRLVYRDDHLLVVDKPPGLSTTPVPGVEDEPTALQAADRLCRGPARPKIVHRLDRDTSGLLMFGRSVPATRALRAALDAQEVHRVYRCVVQGVPEPPAGLLSSMLLREAGQGRRGSRAGTFRVRPLRSPDPGEMPGPGKLAITRYETVVVSQQLNRAGLEVRLATGRTHQIRIHLAELGFPVVGERVYARVAGAPRQALHAARLSFTHPITGEALAFESPWPNDLRDVEPLGPGW